MKHPNEADLALYAGHDLNFLTDWRVGRHVSRCEQCREMVDAFESLRAESAALAELPREVSWNRLASEMKANIRLGLEAGECVSGGLDERMRWTPGFPGLRALLAYGSLIALVVAGIWLQRPVETPALSQPEAAGVSVLEATHDGIELTESGRSLGLRYDASRDGKDSRYINYVADAKGAVGARYVDSNTGYVTVVNVNLE